MSFKGLIQPLYSSLLTGPWLQRRLRAWAEGRRTRAGLPHEVTWYHRVDDPYSHLLAQVLPRFVEKYDVALCCVTVSTPPPNTNPLPELLAAYGLRDSIELADAFGLSMPDTPPSEAAIAVANQRLLSAESGDASVYLELAAGLGAQLWSGEVPELPASEVVADWPAQLQVRRAALEKRGHYSSGMLHYGGEWYWGIDRLALLEARLTGLGAGAGHTLGAPEVTPFSTLDDRALTCYLSVRSPYSYVALERLSALADEHDLALDIRPILPMVTRGHAVPLRKRLYIFLDTAREAARHNVPFGRVCDPLGRGVSHVIAVFFAAQREGKGQPFLQAAMRGIWSEGVEVASLGGLHKITDQVGLSRELVAGALADDAWLETVEQHRLELLELGLWGVPSFKLGDWSTWGQDRLWLLAAKLGKSSSFR